MDKELACDFYFGDDLGNQIELMDYSALNGFKNVLKNKQLKWSGFKWQSGVLSLLFKPYKYYIITGSPAFLSNWLLVIFSKFSKKKVYAWSHGLKKPVSTRGDIFRKTFYRLFDKIFLYGDHSREIMIKEGFKEDKLIPIYNSLDHEHQLQLRNSLTETNIYIDFFKNDDPVIIYVGRLQKSKKLNLLVLALKKLNKKGINCNLVLVGSDMGNTEIVDLATNNNLEENIWFYGPCYDERIIGELFYNASVCVSPGPVGLTALHSLTFGCPVISNNDFENQMPEFEVIIPKKTGAFFENDDIDSLTERISEWIYSSKEKRQLIRKDSYKIIDEKWNPKNQIDIIKTYLN
ncbi:glycosyltransferase [Maribacter algarum]|nr:glycosyltransferase [Maribacter algarum]